MSGAARGYSWAPFEKGNTTSVHHGAHSERFLRPVVDELLAELAAAAPWTTSRIFAPTVQAWAFAEARALAYRRHFDEHGMDLAAEEPPKGLVQWDRAEGRAASLRGELGLSPSSLTKLLRGLAEVSGPVAESGLEALRKAGAAIRAEVEQASLPPVPDNDDEGGDPL